PASRLATLRRLGARLRGLPVRDLVAPHPPARPLLASALARPGDPRRPGGGLVATPGLAGLAGRVPGRRDPDDVRLRLDLPGRPEPVDRRPAGPPRRRPPHDQPPAPQAR